MKLHNINFCRPWLVGAGTVWLVSCQHPLPKWDLSSKLVTFKYHTAAEEASKEDSNVTKEDTITIFDKDAVIVRARFFFEVYCDEDPNPYFSDEYPPQVYFNMTSDRFEVILETKLVDSNITVALSRDGLKANIVFAGGLVLGDPPQKEKTPVSCALYGINDFRNLAKKYFDEGVLTTEKK